MIKWKFLHEWKTRSIRYINQIIIHLIDLKFNVNRQCYFFCYFFVKSVSNDQTSFFDYFNRTRCFEYKYSNSVISKSQNLSLRVRFIFSRRHAVLATLHKIIRRRSCVTHKSAVSFCAIARGRYIATLKQEFHDKCKNYTLWLNREISSGNSKRKENAREAYSCRRKRRLYYVQSIFASNK